MSAIESIEFFVALNLIAIGSSHFFQPKIWIDFFELLHSKGNAGNIINALIALGMGTLIISFHFSWKWPMLLVTVYGLLLFIKGITYLIFPAFGLKRIASVRFYTTKFRWAGLIMVLLGLIIIISLIKGEVFNFLTG